MVTLNEDSVVRVGIYTARVKDHIAWGRLKRNAAGEFVTTGAHPHAPLLIPDPPPYVPPKIAPNSLAGLQARGYRVMRGNTPEEDRVEIGGGFFRITAAIQNGLIKADEN
ncbi:hypothetical protein GTP55_10410 [Duganella sp. FT109W]|uniref:Uncharacterized protein n=1 Tax=Duganella margarita TaxID=2692170 RepID=A0ABW9WHY2_9BURK|nr:hypothetical protein [Duganella margarita]MYN39785.1 hypothetical protein [Duganella margarita]